MVDHPIEKLTYQMANQPIDKLTNEMFDPPIDKLTYHMVEQPAERRNYLVESVNEQLLVDLFSTKIKKCLLRLLDKYFSAT